MESVRTRDTGTLQYDCSSATIPNAWYTRDIVTPRPFLSTSRISGKRWPHLLRPALALARSAELPPGADEGTRGLAGADLLPVPVDIQETSKAGQRTQRGKRTRSSGQKVDEHHGGWRHHGRG